MSGTRSIYAENDATFTKNRSIKRQIVGAKFNVPADNTPAKSARITAHIVESENPAISDKLSPNLNAYPPLNIAAEPASKDHTDADFDELYVQTKPLKSPKYPAPSKSTFIHVLFTQVMSLIFEWFSPLTKIYESYKTRGMLGIFFLTFAGAALVLAGFGYLIQLLIDEIGAGSKSLLMSATAIGVIGGGIVLKVKPKFGEFASAIVALALIDTASVVLWQKVMLFIGIGVFILLASFWYQKLVTKDAEALATGK